MLSFRIFNIPVHVQPWFWLTLFLIGGGLRVGNDPREWLLPLMFIVAGFISILVHELGHALMIKKYGLPTEIHLIAFGGYATFPQGYLSRKQSFLVTAAGPGLQVCLGFAALLFWNYAPVTPLSLMNNLLDDLIKVSFAWAILNCLPVYPMDGGQMLSAILGPQRQHTTYMIGFITALAIGIISFVLLQALLLTIFMGFFAYQNWKNYQSARGF